MIVLTPTQPALLEWVLNAKSGDLAEFHRGHLAFDRWINPLRKHMPHSKKLLNSVARAADKLESDGVVAMRSKRHGINDTSYMVVKL